MSALPPTLVAIDSREHARLQEVEKAWSAVFMALLEGNDRCFIGPLNGIDSAVAEIKRLQAVAGAPHA